MDREGEENMYIFELWNDALDSRILHHLRESRISYLQENQLSRNIRYISTRATNQDKPTSIATEFPLSRHNNNVRTYLCHHWGQ